MLIYMATIEHIYRYYTTTDSIHTDGITDHNGFRGRSLLPTNRTNKTSHAAK
jgi:hypothetical protein